MPPETAVLCAVLSMDAMDMSGESSAGRGYAINGEIHKVLLNAEGERIGLDEYIPPRRYGFFLGGQREVEGYYGTSSCHHAITWTCAILTSDSAQLLTHASRRERMQMQPWMGMRGATSLAGWTCSAWRAISESACVLRSSSSSHRCARAVPLKLCVR